MAPFTLVILNLPDTSIVLNVASDTSIPSEVY
jgi:hypothetical protein